MLLPPKPGSALHKSALEQLGDAAPTHDFWKDVPADSTRADDLARKRQWRAPKEAVEALRAVVKKFEGTHNFHNFTVGQDYKDPSSKRLIKSIEVSHCCFQKHASDSSSTRSRTPLSTGKPSGSAYSCMARVSCFTRYVVHSAYRVWLTGVKIVSSNVMPPPSFNSHCVA